MSGASPMTPADAWLQLSVHQFFSAINWEDQAAPVRLLQLSTPKQSSDAPLSLTLSVGQFFAAVNWDGVEIAAAGTPFLVEPAPPSPPDDFTLDGFSDLF